MVGNGVFYSVRAKLLLLVSCLAYLSTMNISRGGQVHCVSLLSSKTVPFCRPAHALGFMEIYASVSFPKLKESLN
jgi:hypothetical protein